MSKKSLVNEMRDTQLAIELIELGARPQVLEAETTLSRERLLKLYKEVKGVAAEGHVAVLARLVPDLVAQRPFLAVHQHPPLHHQK